MSAAILLFLLVFVSSGMRAETRPTHPVRLLEYTYDGQSRMIYRGNSVDYRSYILVKFIDSLAVDKLRIKTEVIRKNGGRFEIPLPDHRREIVSDTIAYDSAYYVTAHTAPRKDTRIDLQRWAVEPGDKVHVKIDDRKEYFPLLERHIQVAKHGVSGYLSFPILCVQRGGDNPGTLGAGISYTLRYVKPERSLANKLGFGLNLSFLDFDPEQKIEIGLGFVLSFPDDLFQIGAGTNLTVNHDPNYYFLGINLLGLKEKIGW